MEPLDLQFPIVTERLVIRPWEVDDVDVLAEAVTRSVEHLRPWMSWIQFEPMTRGDRIDLIRRKAEERRAGTDVMLGILTHDGSVIGGTGFHPRIGDDGLEIGYWIGVDVVRRGYASEAAAALTSAAFTLPGIDRVEIHHDRANEGSRRVAERLGFAFVEERRDTVKAPREVGLEWIWRMERDRWVADPAVSSLVSPEM